VPLGYSLGLQVDGAIANIQGLLQRHLAAHLFWRDPARALIGGYAAFDTWAGITRQRLAIEAEIYFGRVTIEGLWGFEFGTLPNSWFGAVDVAFYPMDDLRLSIGLRHAFAGNAFAGGIEYQFATTPNVGWAAFGEAVIGTAGYQRILGGIRLYFGQGPTLIERHRRDDPRIHADEMGCGAYVSDGATVVDGQTLIETAVVAVDTAFCATDALIEGPTD
jgi:hypothetical protein